MEFEFLDPALEELYRLKKSRKYRFQPQILKKFFKRIAQIEAADTTLDFWKTGSLHFEKLEGSVDEFSMRLNDQWRLEVGMRWADEGKTRGVVLIIQLTNHYGG